MPQHGLVAEHLLAAISVSTIAAVLLALLARRVGQPLILGYILGGVLLGPQLGFGIVRDRQAIDLIAEIGRILLLFIVGLEINVRQIARAGRAIMAPSAKVIVAADTMAGAERLYADGADDVLVAPVLTAEHLHEILRAETPDAIEEARRRQELEVGLRTTPAAPR